MNSSGSTTLRRPFTASFSFLFLLNFLPTFTGLAAVLASTTALAATTTAPLSRDLGQGLAYHRVAILPSDLPTNLSTRKQPCVVDLRYARGDAAAAAALVAWLRFHAAPRTPLFILINAETEPPLLTALAARIPLPGLLVIGSPAPGLTPDIVLKPAPADERRAYDALATGTAIEALLNDTPEKNRNDEAQLVKDYQRQGAADPTAYQRPADDEPIDDLAPPPASATPAAKPKPPAPLIDTALQRAVHLHRSLRALKKL